MGCVYWFQKGNSHPITAVSILFLKILLVYSCFTTFVSFYCTGKWISHTYTYTLSFLDFLPIWVATEYWIEFPELYNKFSLVIYFIHGINSIYICQQLILPYPHPWCSYVCSAPLCLCLCFADKIIYAIFLDLIHSSFKEQRSWAQGGNRPLFLQRLVATFHYKFWDALVFFFYSSRSSIYF